MCGLISLSVLLGAEVVRLDISGPINSITQEYVENAFDQIEEKVNAELIVLVLDTPGGLDSSMRAIIKRILNSPRPVVVYVSPKGARAASAGLFITVSAHIAAMAPGTNMGAAHPVSAMGGKVSDEMNEKITNDAVAYLESIADEKQRNLTLVAKAIRESKSYTAETCLKEGLIDIIARDMDHLLEQIDGRSIRSSRDREMVINLTSRQVVSIEMSGRQRFLKTITNPNIAYFLLILGLAGLYIEFTHPGGIIPGVLGGICLLLAFLAFQVLPINYIGIFLILLSIGLFIAEIKVAGFGILGVGGIISFFLGSMMLINAKIPEMRPAFSIIITLSICFGVIVLFLTYKVIESMKRKPSTGQEWMIGGLAEVKKTITGNSGKVFMRGELWDARSMAGERIPLNSRVKVKRMEGFILYVTKVEKEGT